MVAANRKAGNQRVRLNRRGRIFVGTLIAIALWWGSAMVLPSQAHSESGPMEVVAYTVQPGDTLWGFASKVTPQGGDVAAMVDELIELNGLSSANIEAGQRIVVPED